MSKLTLFDIVADVLSDMNDDEVDSITTTLESLQVANIAKSVYYEFIDGKNWPHLRKLGQLQHSGNVSRPTHMVVPEEFVELSKVEYDVKKELEADANYKHLPYRTPEEFLLQTSTYKSTADNVETVQDPSGAYLNIKNDVAPSFWTSFDDNNVVFNSYDSGLDTTLQNEKSRIYGDTRPSFTLADEFIPDLPAEMFSAYLAEVKSTCFIRMKQAPDQKAEQQARRQKARMSRRAWRTESKMKLPAKGRRSRK